MRGEIDIMHETPHGYWVARDKDRYSVWRPASTHSKGDSAYPKTDDGLSLAKARADYLDKTPAKRR